MQIEAPIVAVTVHPERARITRSVTVELPVGTSQLVIIDLPPTMIDDSVRVAGRSAEPVRVVGVDLRHRDLAEVPDERVRAAESAVREAERALAGADGQDSADAAREELLQRLARRSGDQLAAALADGRADTARVAEIGAAVAAQLVETAAARRGNTERREDAAHALDAARAELDRLRGTGRQRREAVITVEAEAAAELQLEFGYVATGAGWSSAYDARIHPRGSAGELVLTWYGMVTQVTGEDWPECQLTLSTARPAVASSIPELHPWWIDLLPPPQHRAAPAPAQMLAFDAAAGHLERAKRVTAMVAEPVNGTLAASWRLPRPTAVAADGTPHRTTVAAFDLPGSLDHITAPAEDPAAHLRATVANSSGQVLLAGSVATFVDDAFVGTGRLDQTAPGEDIELALGVDDRVVVERELVERSTRRARFGSTHGALERWRITVRNGGQETARVIVRDRLPVSRHADVKVVDVAITPEPAERDDLGRLEWVAQIEPGKTWEASVRFAVEHPKDAVVTGWR